EIDTNGNRIPALTVSVSDSGSNGGGAPLSEGVSLVVVYEDVDRDKRGDPSSYRTAIIYDGSVTLNNATDEIIQRIGGIDQASAGLNPNYIGYILGDGQPNFPEIVQIGPNNTTFTKTIDSPFNGVSGGTPFWDDQTFALSSAELPTNAGAVTTRIGHNQGSFDCLLFAAIYVGADTVDLDADGIVDYWETPLDPQETIDGGIHGFRDPETGKLLLNLAAMGAKPGRKDVFIESDFMYDDQSSPA